MCQHLYARTVILDLHELEATVFDCDAYGRCAGIQTIFQELFERRSWTVYYLNVDHKTAGIWTRYEGDDRM